MQKVCFDIYWHCFVMWPYCSGAVRLMTSNNDSVVRVFDCNNFSVLKSFYFPWAVNVCCTFSVSCRSGCSIFYQATVLDENPFFCSAGLAVPCSSRWPLWDFSKRDFRWFMLWHCGTVSCGFLSCEPGSDCFLHSFGSIFFFGPQHLWN
jgi:hypothetical protein